MGKLKRIRNCSNKNNTFLIVAIDHRTSLLKSLGLDSNSGNYEPLKEIKSEIIECLSATSSALLLDPEIGLPIYLGSEISRNSGLIVSIEKSGYKGSKNLRKSELLPGWDLKKSIRLGVDGIKLLVYYHPEAKNKQYIESLISKVVEQSNVYELPLFLEIVTYSIDSGLRLVGKERTDVILKSVQILSRLGPDVIKVQFPFDIDLKDKIGWNQACEDLSSVSRSPWVLLSESVDFKTYRDQVKIACQRGCSGVAVGRAVWKDIIDLDSKTSRIDFLNTTGQQRLKLLEEICVEHAQPWSGFYESPRLEDNWFETY